MVEVQAQAEFPNVAYSHDLQIESERSEEDRGMRTNIDPHIEIFNCICHNSYGVKAPRVKLLCNERVLNSPMLLPMEKQFLTNYMGTMGQMALENTFDKENIVRINWGDVVTEFMDQANAVFGLVDKKSFFDWQCAETEAQQLADAPSISTLPEIAKIKAAAKRNRMVEGIKEKWYTFLLLDAVRFCVDGEGFHGVGDVRILLYCPSFLFFS